MAGATWVGRLKGGFLFLVLCASCATIPRLDVSYRLPEPAEDRAVTVFLEVQDGRGASEMIGPGAAQTFRGFPGSVFLFLSGEGVEMQSAGFLNVPELFHKAFRKRLEHEGFHVVSRRKETPLVLVVCVEAFLLDLVGKQWVMKAGYEARVLRDEMVVSKQKVSGQSQRYKIIGRREASELVGDLFTDLVNKMDSSMLLEGKGR